MRLLAPTDRTKSWLRRHWVWGVYLVLAVYLFRTVHPNIDLTEVHGPAPDFSLQTLDGEPFRLSDQRGKVVVLNFWATWCPPCRMEIPGFIDLQQEFAEDVVFVGVSLDDDGAASVGPYAREKGINYPMLIDGWTAARAYGGIDTVPTTYVIDRAGAIRYRHEGFLAERALRPALDALRKASGR